VKYLHLIRASLFRRKGRTVLTLLAILVSFLLFGVLDTVRSTFSNFGQTTRGYDRLITISKMSFGQPLPLSLYSQIKNVAGVVKIDYGSGFVGTYQNPRNAVYAESHTDSFFDLYPELAISPAERLALRSARAGAIAGESLARTFNWKVGDKIPLKTAVNRKDGSNVWTFDLVGIYRFTDANMKPYENQLFISTAYLQEAGLAADNTVTFYALKIDNPTESDRIAEAVDAISANSDHETKTQSENAFSAALIGQIGDSGAIVTSIMGAVFFTLLLVTGHSITQAVSERIPELAILKTIGFTGRKILGLVLSESVILLVLGSVIGLAIATVAVREAHSLLEETLPMPILPVGGGVWLRGLIFAIGVGLVVGALPAWRGMRLRIVDALSGR